VSSKHPKKKIRILVTAGPTREKIDPIRFISNYSTGTFGYAVAYEAKRRGCKVVLISGPVSLDAPKGIKLIKVESALDMERSVMSEFPKADCIMMAAAVADWRASSIARHKIKKAAGGMVVKLTRNPDILKELGRKKKNKILVGFALETEDLELNARKKLKSKGLDLVVANRFSQDSGVFGDKKTEIMIIDKYGCKTEVGARTKAALAKIILDKALGINI